MQSLRKYIDNNDVELLQWIEYEKGDLINMSQNTCNNITKIFNRIASEYYHLNKKHKKELFENYNIDSGTDYAKYVLEEICYNENGESLY